jgi:hypothetical protein
MPKVKFNTLQELEGYGWRRAVAGGWVYIETLPGNEGIAAAFVPSPQALHVRDTRRLRLREGYEPHDSNGIVTVWQNKLTLKSSISECFARALVIAFHADGSETDHATRLEAHDALIASGSESPFEVVTGVIPKVGEVER